MTRNRHLIAARWNEFREISLKLAETDEVASALKHAFYAGGAATMSIMCRELATGKEKGYQVIDAVMQEFKEFVSKDAAQPGPNSAKEVRE
jgi:hypothetical protein